MNKISEIASQLGKIGGKKSVEARFKGKSQEEISKIMSDVRISPKLKKKLDIAVESAIVGMNKNIEMSMKRNAESRKAAEQIYP